MIRHILCINTRILRAEIQLQARSIELEGRIAADFRRSCHCALAVSVVFTVGRIKTVAVGRLAIGFLCLLVAKLHANRIPSPGIIGKALFIVNRSSRDKADTQHLLRISRVADCNIGRSKRRQNIRRRIHKFLHAFIIRQRSVRDRFDCSRAILISHQVAQFEADREAKVENIILRQVLRIDLIVKRQRLAVRGDICTDVLIQAASVLRSDTRNRRDILIKCLMNAGAVDNICVVFQPNRTGGHLARILQRVEVRRHVLLRRVGHNNLRGSDLLLIGIIIIDDLEVALLRSRFQIDQDKLCRVFFRPSFAAYLAVDHRRCTGRLVPNLALVIPLHSGVVRHLVPSDCIIGIPNIITFIRISRSICNSYSSDIVIRIVTRSNDANISISTIMIYRRRMTIHLSFCRRDRAIRVHDRNC